MIRTSLRFTTLCAGLLLSASALALSLGDLSQKDATGGLKDALTQGAQLAVKHIQIGVQLRIDIKLFGHSKFSR